MTMQDRARRLIILGSTGSIGSSTLDVVDHLRGDGWTIDIVGLAAGRRSAELARQVNRYDVRHVSIADVDARDDVISAVRHDITLYAGSESAVELIDAVARPGDLVVGAMVGAAGIPAVVAAIERGCTIALANKETLVAAGALVMPLAARHGVTILPVDSEHNAIYQCLRSGRHGDEVERLVLTASGGPFRTWSAERTANATVEEALNHPTWTMGRKVTIDSATLMNKALELIEAHWLFGVPSSKIDAIVHPASLVHSFVEFVDGSVLAQISPPDMRLPIQYALTWPERTDGRADRLDWTSFRELVFEPVDHERFGAIRLALEVIDAGGTAGAVMNAANEVAVHAFLDGELRFGGIVACVAHTVHTTPETSVQTMDDIIEADRAARDIARAWLDTTEHAVRHSAAARTGVK